ncbi:MAG: NIL domain-containing protein [Desulfomicrobium sp.]|jgi:ferredoxin|nr:NIL domain-containing protein [Desulfomicrobium sp.]NLV97585.1 4Fe-4S binding protein [Desulfovibrionales bacterium]
MINHEYSRIISLSFPPDTSGQPMMYNLAKLFDLTFNILQANINPRREGHMILELSGTRERYQRGVTYLQEQGIRVTPAANQISRNEDSCMHCGLCTSLCPSKALHLNHETRRVDFDQNKCTACNMCVTICPVRAMTVEIDPLTW